MTLPSFSHPHLLPISYNALKYINYYLIKHLTYIWNYLLHNTWWITFQYSAFYYIGFLSPVEFHCFIPASTLYSLHDLHMLVQCMDNEIILCIIIVLVQSKAWLIRWSLCTYTKHVSYIHFSTHFVFKSFLSAPLFHQDNIDYISDIASYSSSRVDIILLATGKVSTAILVCVDTDWNSSRINTI